MTDWRPRRLCLALALGGLLVCGLADPGAADSPPSCEAWGNLEGLTLKKGIVIDVMILDLGYRSPHEGIVLLKGEKKRADFLIEDDDQRFVAGVLIDEHRLQIFAKEGNSFAAFTTKPEPISVRTGILLRNEERAEHTQTMINEARHIPCVVTASGFRDLLPAERSLAWGGMPDDDGMPKEGILSPTDESPGVGPVGPPAILSELARGGATPGGGEVGRDEIGELMEEKGLVDGVPGSEDRKPERPPKGRSDDMAELLADPKKDEAKGEGETEAATIIDEKEPKPKEETRAADPRGTAFCQVSPSDKGLSLNEIQVLDISEASHATLAAKRKTETVGRAYEYLAGTLLDSDWVFDMTTSAGTVIAYRPLREPREETLSDGSSIEVFPVTFTSMGPLRLDGERPETTLPVMHVMVFGGKTETAFSGLDQVEAHLDGLNRMFLLEVEYHQLLPDKSLAEPALYSRLSALVKKQSKNLDPKDFVIVEDDFASFLLAVEERIVTSGLPKIDHVFIIKSNYTLPEETPLRFGEFLDRMEAIEALPHSGERLKRWISIISGEMVDSSNNYLRQPLIKRFPVGELFEEDSSQPTEKRRFIANPEALAVKLNAIFSLPFQFSARRVATAPEGLVADGLEVFANKGMLLSESALKHLRDRAERVVAVVKEAPTGADALARLDLDGVELNAARAGVIDVIAMSDGLAPLRSKHVTPPRLRKALMQVEAAEMPQLRGDLQQFLAVLEAVGASLASPQGRDCGHVYLPLARDFSAIGERP